MPDWSPEQGRMWDLVEVFGCRNTARDDWPVKRVMGGDVSRSREQALGLFPGPEVCVEISGWSEP